MLRILRTILIGVLFFSAVACNRYESRPTGARPAAMAVPRDMQISEDAKRSLDAKGLTDVQVETENGEVTLTGRVGGPEQKLLAEESVKSMPGVVTVKNNVKVVVEEREFNTRINPNSPGGPRKQRSINANKPGGPRKDSNVPFER